VTGLDERDNLLLLSTDGLEKDILSLPWVAAAEVDRRLPDTVRVKIEEREPALVIEVPSGRWTIDAHGRVLEEGRASPKLPILSGAITGGLEAGEQVSHDGVVGGLKVWRSLPHRLRNDIVALFAPSAERISFSFRDHTLVRYGSSRDRIAKRRVLLALLERIKDRHPGSNQSCDRAHRVTDHVAPAADSHPDGHRVNRARFLVDVLRATAILLNHHYRLT
jgi:cell division protein FtsQ